MYRMPPWPAFGWIRYVSFVNKKGILGLPDGDFRLTGFIKVGNGREDPSPYGSGSLVGLTREIMIPVIRHLELVFSPTVKHVIHATSCGLSVCELPVQHKYWKISPFFNVMDILVLFEERLDLYFTKIRHQFYQTKFLSGKHSLAIRIQSRHSLATWQWVDLPESRRHVWLRPQALQALYETSQRHKLFRVFSDEV